jgi:hypothetical protein
MGGVGVTVAEREAEHSASAAFWWKCVHRALYIKARAVVRRVCVERRGLIFVEVSPSCFAAMMIEKAAVGDAE